MKRIFAGLLLGLLIFTGCVPATLESAPPPASATATIPPPTLTPSPTQIPPTQTVTPLPTIPTFTPTFDASTIVTVTPAAKAECPMENPDLIPSFPIRTKGNYFIENSAEILLYLNEGGKLKKATERLALVADPESPVLEDVTGDKIPELVFVDYAEEPKLHVFSCESGQYRDIVPDINDDLTGYSTASGAIVTDLNQNGVSDILLRTRCSRHLGCTSLFILEWDGSEFINRLEPREIFVSFTERKIEDINSDGTLDVTIKQGIPGDYEYYMGFPWRVSTYIYMWNGNKYALQNIQYTKSEYQFQAIQDADRAVMRKEYGLSMDLYEMAITDKSLLPYSRELSQHMEWLFWNPSSLGVATQPAPNPTEYSRLAAYAYYRIMLLHLVQGNVLDAEAAYNTLQETFGSEPDGKPYAEMATTFRNAYQSSQEMYDGCAAAIQYAAQHPEILVPLGSDYHGSQSHIYVHADVCPFR